MRIYRFCFLVICVIWINLISSNSNIKITSSLTLHSYPNQFNYQKLSSANREILLENLKLTFTENDNFILVTYASEWVDNSYAYFRYFGDLDPIIIIMPNALPLKILQNFKDLTLVYTDKKTQTAFEITFKINFDKNEYE